MIPWAAVLTVVAVRAVVAKAANRTKRRRPCPGIAAIFAAVVVDRMVGDAVICPCAGVGAGLVVGTDVPLAPDHRHRREEEEAAELLRHLVTTAAQHL